MTPGFEPCSGLTDEACKAKFGFDTVQQGKYGYWSSAASAKRYCSAWADCVGYYEEPGNQWHPFNVDALAHLQWDAVNSKGAWRKFCGESPVWLLVSSGFSASGRGALPSPTTDPAHQPTAQL